MLLCFHARRVVLPGKAPLAQRPATAQPIPGLAGCEKLRLLVQVDGKAPWGAEVSQRGGREQLLSTLAKSVSSSTQVPVANRNRCKCTAWLASSLLSVLGEAAHNLKKGWLLEATMSPDFQDCLRPRMHTGTGRTLLPRFRERRKQARYL